MEAEYIFKVGAVIAIMLSIAIALFAFWANALKNCADTDAVNISSEAHDVNININVN